MGNNSGDQCVIDERTAKIPESGDQQDLSSKSENGCCGTTNQLDHDHKVSEPEDQQDFSSQSDNEFCRTTKSNRDHKKEDQMEKRSIQRVPGPDDQQDFSSQSDNGFCRTTKSNRDHKKEDQMEKRSIQQVSEQEDQRDFSSQSDNGFCRTIKSNCNYKEEDQVEKRFTSEPGQQQGFSFKSVNGFYRTNTKSNCDYKEEDQVEKRCTPESGCQPDFSSKSENGFYRTTTKSNRDYKEEDQVEKRCTSEPGCQQNFSSNSENGFYRTTKSNRDHKQEDQMEKRSIHQVPGPEDQQDFSSRSDNGFYITTIKSNRNYKEEDQVENRRTPEPGCQPDVSSKSVNVFHRTTTKSNRNYKEEDQVENRRTPEPGCQPDFSSKSVNVFHRTTTKSNRDNKEEDQLEKRRTPEPGCQPNFSSKSENVFHRTTTKSNLDNKEEDQAENRRTPEPGCQPHFSSKSVNEFYRTTTKSNHDNKEEYQAENRRTPEPGCQPHFSSKSVNEFYRTTTKSNHDNKEEYQAENRRTPEPGCQPDVSSKSVNVFHRTTTKSNRDYKEEDQVETSKRVLQLVTESMFSMMQVNGQRKLGGPPPGWKGPPPGPGCEVFVGKIPRTLYEHEIYPVFREMGEVYEIRLMMDFSGTNRGYCFVMFGKPEFAERAVRELNNHEIRPGRRIGVVASINNCRLYVGQLPHGILSINVIKKICQITDDVAKVSVYRYSNDQARYALISYRTHRGAAMARRRLVPDRAALFEGAEVSIDWAHPSMIPSNVVEESGIVDEKGNVEVTKIIIGSENRRSTNRRHVRDEFLDQSIRTYLQEEGKADAANRSNRHSHFSSGKTSGQSNQTVHGFGPIGHQRNPNFTLLDRNFSPIGQNYSSGGQGHGQGSPGKPSFAKISGTNQNQPKRRFTPSELRENVERLNVFSLSSVEHLSDLEQGQLPRNLSAGNFQANRKVVGWPSSRVFHSQKGESPSAEGGGMEKTEIDMDSNDLGKVSSNQNEMGEEVNGLSKDSFSLFDDYTFTLNPSKFHEKFDGKEVPARSASAEGLTPIFSGRSESKSDHDLGTRKVEEFANFSEYGKWNSVEGFVPRSRQRDADVWTLGASRKTDEEGFGLETNIPEGCKDIRCNDQGCGLVGKIREDQTNPSSHVVNTKADQGENRQKLLLGTLKESLDVDCGSVRKIGEDQTNPFPHVVKKKADQGDDRQKVLLETFKESLDVDCGSVRKIREDQTNPFPHVVNTRADQGDNRQKVLQGVLKESLDDAFSGSNPTGRRFSKHWNFGGFDAGNSSMSHRQPSSASFSPSGPGQFPSPNSTRTQAATPGQRMILANFPQNMEMTQGHPMNGYQGTALHFPNSSMVQIIQNSRSSRDPSGSQFPIGARSFGSNPGYPDQDCLVHDQMMHSPEVQKFSPTPGFYIHGTTLSPIAKVSSCFSNHAYHSYRANSSNFNQGSHGTVEASNNSSGVRSQAFVPPRSNVRRRMTCNANLGQSMTSLYLEDPSGQTLRPSDPIFIGRHRSSVVGPGGRRAVSGNSSNLDYTARFTSDVIPKGGRPIVSRSYAGGCDEK